MTPTQRAAAQQALEALGTLKIALRVGMPEYGAEDQDELLETANTALRAALAEQQDVQEVPQHLADDERVAALCDLSYVAGMKAGWNFCVSDDSDGLERCQNSVGEAIRILKAHRAAPTPPAPKPLGWLDRKAVECLQGPELNWMPAWNRPTSADPVPVFLGPPTQRVMLTANEILNMTPESIPEEHDGALLEYARAVIEAYERKNGLATLAALKPKEES